MKVSTTQSGNQEKRWQCTVLHCILDHVTKFHLDHIRVCLSTLKWNSKLFDQPVNGFQIIFFLDKFPRVAAYVVHWSRGFEASLSVSFKVLRRPLSAPKMSTSSLCMHLEKNLAWCQRSTNKVQPKRYLACVHLL